MKAKARFLGHPIHQMLVVFPLGLLGTSVVFDLIHHVGGSPEMALVAYWTMAAGLVGGAVAAPFGLADWLAIPRGTRAKTVGALHVTEQAAAGPRDGACAVPSIAATRGKSGAAGDGPSEEDLWARPFRTGSEATAAAPRGEKRRGPMPQASAPHLKPARGPAAACAPTAARRCKPRASCFASHPHRGTRRKNQRFKRWSFHPAAIHPVRQPSLVQ